MSRICGTYVDTLKSLVQRAWKNCAIDYIQLAVMRLVEPQESNRYLEQVIEDLDSFRDFDTYLKDAFQKRLIWHAWRYIHGLTEKYIRDAENCQEQFEYLNTIKDKWF